MPGESVEEIEERLELLMERELEKRRRVREEEKVRSLIFDSSTIRAFVKLFNKGVLRDFTWIISAGKEAMVLSGVGPDGELAIKVYRVATANFGRYLDYIVGDYRFVPVKSKRKLIRLWARKEYRNLARLFEVGVRVPRPIDVVGNVLVMQLIGEGGFPAPLLREVPELPDPEAVMWDILGQVRISLLEAELVHGDLSEYNVMYWLGLPWIIDVSQAVVSLHPKARELLRRDVEKIAKYFSTRYKVRAPNPWEFVESLLREAGF
ncbi:MAG: serine protein kinase RIO [Thermoproteota archaeon]|nr:MAG: serine protein kinase RIO [Candidatus Korarchaeota archaeon]